MAADPKLVVALEARLDRFEGQLKQAGVIAERTVNDIEQKFARANPKVNFLQGIFQGIGQELAKQLQKIPDFVREAVSSLADIGDVAERIGITTDALQALRFATQQNGGELKDADRALEKFAQTIGRAGEGGGYLAKIFEANNIAIKDSNGKYREQGALLEDFARLVAGASSAQERMTLVTEAFGRGAGTRMVQSMLEIANKGLPAVINASQEAGVVIDEQLIKKAKQFDDAWKESTLRTQTYLKSWAVEAIAALADVWEKLKEIRGQGRPLSDLLPRPQTSAQMEAEAESRRERRSRFPSGSTPPLDLPKTVLPERGAGGATEDAFKRATDSINKHIAAILADAAAIGLTNAAHEQLKAELKLLEVARQADVKITDEQMEAYARLRANGLGPLQAIQAANIPLTAANAAAFENLSNRMGAVVSAADRAKTAFQGMNDALRFGGNELINVIDKATQKGAKFGDIMSDVLRNISKQFLQAAITGEGAFAKMFGFNSTTGGVGGILGLLSKLIPGNAAGSANWRGGMTWVGEKGPELINLPRGTQIIPNEVAKGMSDGMHLSLHTAIDARGSDISEARLRIILAEHGQQIRHDVVPIIRDAKSRRAL